MSKRLLRLALIFVLFSFTTTAFAAYIPSSAAPSYCKGFVPSLPSAPGTSPTSGFLPGINPGSISYTPTAGNGNQNIIGSSIDLSIIALTLSFAILAVAYALSRLFPHLGIRNWLQMEYQEITKSIILFCVIFALITILGNMTLAFFVPPQAQLNGGDLTPVINGAEVYLCGVNSNLMNVWEWMGLLGAGTGFWGNLKLGTFDGIPVWTYIGLVSGTVFIPFNNWMLQTGNVMIGPYGSIIGDTINLMLFPFTVLNSIAIDALPSMAAVGLSFFIPLGLLFRAIPFVRGIGGTLIAIGIGLAIVFPAVLVMFNGVVMNYLVQAIAIQPPYVNQSLGTGFGGSSPCPFSSSFGFVGTTFCDTSLILPPLSLHLTSIQSGIVFTATDDSPGYLNGANVFSDFAVYQYMDIMLALVSYIVVQLFMITLDLVIVYSITDSIARALGGSVRLQLGSKLRIAS